MPAPIPTPSPGPLPTGTPPDSGDGADADAGPAPPIPERRYDLRVLSAVRRIIRATDLYSHRLIAHQGVTIPQLLCLTQVCQSGGMTIKDLSREIHVSPSTVVGVVDRLEARGLVVRHRAKPDKRLVYVIPTEEGRDLVHRSPSPLHETLVSGLRELPPDRQQEIAEAVEQLVGLMEIEQLEAAPILETKAALEP